MFCEWEITTNNPEGQLFVEVTFMNIEYESLCSYDYLEILEGKISCACINSFLWMKSKKDSKNNMLQTKQRVRFKGTATKWPVQKLQT